jgi:hypothetical protein
MCDHIVNRIGKIFSFLVFKKYFSRRSLVNFHHKFLPCFHPKTDNSSQKVFFLCVPSSVRFNWCNEVEGVLEAVRHHHLYLFIVFDGRGKWLGGAMVVLVTWKIFERKKWQYKHRLDSLIHPHRNASWENPWERDFPPSFAIEKFFLGSVLLLFLFYVFRSHKTSPIEMG